MGSPLCSPRPAAHLLAGRGAKPVLGVRRTGRLDDIAADLCAEVGAEVRTLATDVTLAEDLAAPAGQTETGSQIPDFAISPDAVARAVACALEQALGVEIGDLTTRPTARG